MKCSVPRCPEQVVAPSTGRRKGRLVPPALDLCKDHRRRFEREYDHHYAPAVDELKKRWKSSHKVTQERLAAVCEALVNAGHVKSWMSTWLQMVDLEMLNAGNGTQEGLLLSPPKPSVSITPVKRTDLPEHATREGQAAIQKREAEQQLLEKKLAADRAEYERGRRMELELELKTKREAELRAAVKRAKEKA